MLHCSVLDWVQDQIVRLGLELLGTPDWGGLGAVLYYGRKQMEVGLVCWESCCSCSGSETGKEVAHDLVPCWVEGR